jgi:hypothetical protein
VNSWALSAVLSPCAYARTALGPPRLTFSLPSRFFEAIWNEYDTYTLAASVNPLTRVIAPFSFV